MIQLILDPCLGLKFAEVKSIGLDRIEALRRTTQLYIEHMHANNPVHTWPAP